MGTGGREIGQLLFNRHKFLVVKDRLDLEIYSTTLTL